MIGAKDKLTSSILKHTPLILLALVFVVFGLIAPEFFKYQSLVNAVKQASYIGVVAVGMSFVLLTGGIDLSVGSNMYLSAAAAGVLIQNHSLGVWLGLGVCLSVGFVFGLTNAVAITRLKIMPFVVTLATMVAGRGVGLMITRSHAVDFPDSVERLGSALFLGVVPYPIVVFALTVTCAWALLNRTTIGRQLYAVGHDIESARRAGVNTEKVRALAYIICGVFASLGGFVSVAQLGNVNAGFGRGDEFDAIAAAVLGGVSLFGGVGSVFPGVVLGAVLIQTVSSGLVAARIDMYLHPMITAGVIFLAVFIDSLRNAKLAMLRRRYIRIEE
jgi:ribose/xylose/arabinose/galactoside ABC-type transport system permease subunit